MKKATSGWSINTTLLAISPLSLKHLARQRSPWHGALVSQQLQSFVVCFALLGQSGMSAIWATQTKVVSRDCQHLQLSIPSRVHRAQMESRAYG
ncbi:hypothetical protein [Hyphomicrobium sp. CS1BSMeth3]|uniref:hypothetical protein n=1 Tax=Hyphomicrobium sp. CS1BSMeth3 TaxID=1892844 RepID=UPI00116011C8|nr:hypothetical protein [Hyphomicrobium sp. CS1BSMeth3]